MIRSAMMSALESVGDTWVDEDSLESLARCVYFGDSDMSSSRM